MTQTTKGFTKISNCLLKELLTEPCRTCKAIYEDKIRKLKKELRNDKN